MKEYRVSLPAIACISVAAKSEKEAKMLAVASILTPVCPLEIDNHYSYTLADVAIWVNDEVSENPDKCEILDVRECELKKSITLLQQLKQLAQYNGNEHEFHAASEQILTNPI